MVEKHEIHKEIDKRVNVIDSKLRNSFSMIKKDMEEIKKHHLSSVPHSRATVEYAAKLQGLKLQSTLDRAALEAKYAQKLSALEDKHEELKHTIFTLSKQVQKLHGKKASKELILSKPKKSKTAVFQILIVLAVVGVLGYLLFSHFATSSVFTGVIGDSAGSATFAGITGALIFIFLILGLLFYSKTRAKRKS